MADNYIDLPVVGGGGGGGAVNSVNGATGDIDILGSSNIDVTTFGTNITINAIGNANTFAGFDGSGDLFSVPGFTIDTTSGGMNEALTERPNAAGGGFSANSVAVQFDPLQNSPADTWNINTISAFFDINNSGFNQGTGGEALTLQSLNITHQGTGDIGGISLTKGSFNLGNGTDPIDIKGFAYSYGFGNVSANVNISGPVQGYGFQPNFNAASTISPTNSYINSFYDFANLPITIYGYNSFVAGPTIGTIADNTNYAGMNLNPTVGTLVGSSQVFGVAMSPQIGTIGLQGSYQGISVNPTVTSNSNYAVGLNINMGNVTNAPGVASSLVVQDITYTSNQLADNNFIQIEYTDTVIAGNEVASVSGDLITVQIESGVSTATQVAAAIAANITLVANLTTVITGVASNPQTAFAATNLAGGVNPGRAMAIDVVGDVNIQGALSFTGGLSIGALQSFASLDLGTLLPGVNAVDTLITSPTVAANATVSGIDLLGVNTAMLLSTGTNSTLTSSFLGIAALGLPAVVNMGAGATIDRVCGAVFAISLDAGAGGGTIDEVDLCRSLALPNGITTVTKLKGYAMDLPFGDPGTTTWGFYESPGVNNYFQGNLLIGGTAGSDDVVTNSSVALEIKSTTKAFMNARMTTTEKNALTAVAGMQVYDSTLNQLSYYNGTAWVNI